jgi:hypothetical protein
MLQGFFFGDHKIAAFKLVQAVVPSAVNSPYSMGLVELKLGLSIRTILMLDMMLVDLCLDSLPS